ncbi:MAG: tetratricopeptide repeat protein [Myxococcota bacterium]
MATAADVPTRRAWIFGPLPDLLLGCGLGYVLIAAAVSFAPIDRTTLIVWGGLLTAFTGMPHYGATLLRVYENREDRQRYALFAVWASLLIWAVFAWGVYDAFVGSVMLTVYLTWSPWHYTGQNYGLAVMFLRRGGVDLDPGTKRLLYASFLLSYALAFLTLHSDPNSTTYGPALVGFTYQFLPISLPLVVYANLFLGVAVLYGAALLATAWRLRSAGGALGPAAMLVATQALWFSVPSIALWLTGRTLSALDVAFLFVWVAIGHSVQYLWITTYYAAASEGTPGRARYLGKTLFAGAIVWTVPALVFSPALLGRPSYELGLFMLIASAVNLQHFVLDGAIWKLRDGPVARILLARAKAAGAAATGGSDLARPAFLAVGAVCSVIAIAGPSLRTLVWAPAARTGDTQRAERVERWLGWMGLEEPAHWNRRAADRLAHGDYALATEYYQKSLDLYPNPDAWIGLADVRIANDDIDGAMQALRSSLEVSPTGVAWSGIAMLEQLRRNHDAAARAFAKSVELDPANAALRQRHGRFLLQRGDYPEATAELERAAALNPRLPWVEEDLAKARRY